jgi:Outer membrane protein transport protein (OMPP1/FadL/TodX)
MKKTAILMFAALSVFAVATSQTVDDALRYSQVFYGGTARFMSMGGAFTALGGDLSSLSQNPAGLGVFRSSEISITPQLFSIYTKSGFNGTSTDNTDKFNFPQIGFVARILPGQKESGLIDLNFGYSFNKTNNLSQSIVIQGVNNTSSMADYWATLGNSGNNGAGTPYQQLQGAEGIAFDTWVIDTVTGSGGQKYGTVFSNYGDNPTSAYGQTVERIITNEGYIGEHSFSLGGNYSNSLFFGATFGVTTLRFTSHYEHRESTNVPNVNNFTDFTYTDHYEDKGTGYSLKLGVIYKPVDAVRIGVAFHSPTWYRIDDYYYNDLTSHVFNTSFESSNSPTRFNYALATPYRLLAGVAVQIQKIALLSADYEFVDYSSARFSQTGDGFDYSESNLGIKNTLKTASNIRVGGELRLNSLYLRAGYGYYGKPFQSGDLNSNLAYNTISGGIGFRERNFSVDLAYTNFNYSQKYVLYPVGTDLAGNPIEPAIANLNTMKNMFTLTLGYKFGM